MAIEYSKSHLLPVRSFDHKLPLHGASAGQRIQQLLSLLSFMYFEGLQTNTALASEHQPAIKETKGVASYICWKRLSSGQTGSSNTLAKVSQVTFKLPESRRLAVSQLPTARYVQVSLTNCMICHGLHTFSALFMQDLKAYLGGEIQISQYIRQPEINLAGLPLQQQVCIGFRLASKHDASPGGMCGCNINCQLLKADFLCNGV